VNVTWDQFRSRPARATSPPEATSLDDERLAALARDDPDQFAILYERYADAVFRYALRMLREREAALDATSRVFIRALTALPSYRSKHSRSFRSWLFTIAHNTIVDAGQRRRDHLPLEPLDAAERLREPSRGPEETAIAADERARLIAALERLPASQCEVIELRLAGLTGPEIAEATGTTLSAPYEQRVNAISKNPVQVDVVDGAAILQVYQQIRDCALSWTGGDAVFALMSPHAVQEMYWRGVSMSGIFDTRASQPGSVAATPAAPSSAFVWQPNFSKTDTYFAETHSVWMETMKDGRVVAWMRWYNQEAQPPKAGSPLNGLVFIKIDGQWKLDDWIFGTQIFTDAGR
jgi:RNA polymerase sigma-70 factor (ECF subfamily)